MTATKKPKKVKLKISLPTSWGELTSNQVSIVAKHLSSNPGQPKSLLVYLAIELAELIPNGSSVADNGDILYCYYKTGHGNLLFSSEDIAAMCRHLEWVLNETGPMVSPQIRLLIQPDSDLFDVTFEQYMTADIAHREFIRRVDTLRVDLGDAKSIRSNADIITPLYVMCAALYPRQKFDASLVDADAKYMEALTYAEIYAIVLWFIGAKQALIAKYPHVFSGEGGGESVPGDEEFMGLLTCLNEGRIVDNEKIKKIAVHEVLYQLEDKIKNFQKK